MLSKSFRWVASGESLVLRYHCGSVAWIDREGQGWRITVAGQKRCLVRSEDKAVRWVSCWARHNVPLGRRSPTGRRGGR